MSHKELLLVGSVPFDTVEEVMTQFGGPLGRYLPAVPDGEVGERRSWVNRFCYLLFNGHADLETLKRPKPINGVEQLLPRTREDSWQFRVRPDVDRVRFGNPGTRLGYARDAVASYFVFKTLREKGLLPAELRFQISIPMVNSVVRALYFPDPKDVERIRPGFEEALAAELDVIVKHIPAKDLAVQWDMAWEIQAVSGAAQTPDEAKVETHTAPVARLSKHLPDGVALGFHFCFGTFGGWPAFAPETLGPTVDLANASIEAARRRVDWVHIPVLNTTEHKFYAPLSKLRTKGGDVYLGAIHSMPTLKARIEVARKYLPRFGLAAYCGFGRTPPEQLPQLLADHLQAVKIAGLG
jgi:hypothetical protein